MSEPSPPFRLNKRHMPAANESMLLDEELPDLSSPFRPLQTTNNISSMTRIILGEAQDSNALPSTSHSHLSHLKDTQELKQSVESKIADWKTDLESFLEEPSPPVSQVIEEGEGRVVKQLIEEQEGEKVFMDVGSQNRRKSAILGMTKEGRIQKHRSSTSYPSPSPFQSPSALSSLLTSTDPSLPRPKHSLSTTTTSFRSSSFTKAIPTSKPLSFAGPSLPSGRPSLPSSTRSSLGGVGSEGGSPGGANGLTSPSGSTTSTINNNSSKPMTKAKMMALAMENAASLPPVLPIKSKIPETPAQKKKVRGFFNALKNKNNAAGDRTVVFAKEVVEEVVEVPLRPVIDEDLAVREAEAVAEEKRRVEEEAAAEAEAKRLQLEAETQALAAAERIRSEAEAAELERIRMEEEAAEAERIRLEEERAAADAEAERVRLEEAAEVETARLKAEAAEEERIRLEAEAVEAERIRLEEEAAAVDAQRREEEATKAAEAETIRLEKEAAETERIRLEEVAIAEAARIKLEAEQAESRRIQLETEAKAQQEQSQQAAKDEAERIKLEAKAEAERTQAKREAKAKAEAKRLRAEEEQRLKLEAEAKALAHQQSVEKAQREEKERIRVRQQQLQAAERIRQRKEDEERQAAEAEKKAQLEQQEKEERRRLRREKREREEMEALEMQRADREREEMEIREREMEEAMALARQSEAAQRLESQRLEEEAELERIRLESESERSERDDTPMDREYLIEVLASTPPPPQVTTSSPIKPSSSSLSPPTQSRYQLAKGTPISSFLREIRQSQGLSHGQSETIREEPRLSISRPVVSLPTSKLPVKAVAQLPPSTASSSSRLSTGSSSNVPVIVKPTTTQRPVQSKPTQVRIRQPSNDSDQYISGKQLEVLKPLMKVEDVKKRQEEAAVARERIERRRVESQTRLQEIGKAKRSTTTIPSTKPITKPFPFTRPTPILSGPLSTVTLPKASTKQNEGPQLQLPAPIPRKPSTLVKIPDFAKAHQLAELKRAKASEQARYRITKIDVGKTPGKTSKLRMMERAEYDRLNLEYQREREEARARFMKEKEEQELAAENQWREEKGYKANPLPEFYLK